MEELICAECRKTIELFEKYAKHQDGTVLCKKCFDKLVKKGVVG